MSWVALLLLGVGFGDLAADVAGRRHRPFPGVVTGVVVVVVFALLGDMVGSARDLAGTLVVLVAAVAWLVTSDVRGDERRGAWLPLGTFVLAVTAGFVANPAAPAVGGAIERWLDAATWPGLAGRDPSATLLLFGAMVAQLSTGNLLVRLLLLATNTPSPNRGGAPARLRGGRLLGPMERLLIVGLGMAGDYTAAGVVIAAKGLLRFPELQAVRADQSATSTAIDEVTEYFLVGSFLSWLVAFASLALLRL